MKEFLKDRHLKVDLLMGYRPGFQKGRDHFLHAAATYDVGIDRLVFVGDSRKDVEKALDSGVRFIARLGLLDREQFGRLFPGVPVVNSLDEVLPLLGIPAERKSAEE
jgi:phosphoglycolate phosphatase-like HAD superfamily hydrolase